jgi:hypothetical protein
MIGMVKVDDDVRHATIEEHRTTGTTGQISFAGVNPMNL